MWMSVSPCVYIKMQAEEVKTFGLLGVVDLAHEECHFSVICKKYFLQQRSQDILYLKIVQFMAYVSTQLHDLNFDTVGNVLIQISDFKLKRFVCIWEAIKFQFCRLTPFLRSLRFYAFSGSGSISLTFGVSASIILSCLSGSTHTPP